MYMRMNGTDVPSLGGAWRDVINPASGEVIDQVPDGIPADVDRAVAAAGTAFRSWSGKTERQRGTLLFRAAAHVREEVVPLARLLTTEQGKPLAQATDEIRGFCNILEFYAGIAARPSGDAIHLGGNDDCMVVREPLGICGAIIPWNMPGIIMGWKIGPALLSGNTVIVKPSSTTPLTNLKLAVLMEEAGIPEGVLNIVTGGGESVGETILSHPAIHKVSFTGSVATGSRIREICGACGKDVTLELGGSDPMIVMDDAILGKAVDGALRGRFYNAGQTCTAAKRLYLHQKIADTFIDLLRVKVAQLRVGNGLHPQIDMGPLQNRQQFDVIAEMVADVKDKGEGTIIAGGNPLSGEESGKGYFYQPTLVTDVASDSRLLTDEVFGPVLPIVRVPDLDTAIQEANSTRFGLGASVWTRDLTTVKRVFSEVRAGIVWVNRHLTVPPEIPFGGTGESGTGRENGYRAMDNYTRTKTLFIGW